MSVLSASDFRRILQLASRPAGRRGWYGEQDDARADLRPLRFRPKHESSQIKNCRRPQVSGWRQCDQMWMTNTEFLLQRTVLLSPGIVFKSCIKVRFSIKAIGPVIRFHYCPFALQKKRSWRSWVKFGTNIGGTVSGDWANMAQQELCKAKVRKRFSALKKKFNESQDSSSMSQFGRSFSSKKSKSFVCVLEVTVVTIDRYFYL